MRRNLQSTVGFIIAFALLTLVAPRAESVNISIDFGAFPNTSNGQLTGPSFATTSFGTGGGLKNFTGLTAVGNYSMDFFNNSGAGGSDFSFFFDGANITSVGLGGGTHTMVTGFTPGTALTLNTNPITYNANQGQTGNYFVPGLLAAQGTNSAPAVVTAIPGYYSVDNLYNSGGGNEDYRFVVNDNGSVSASPGTSGSLAIPHSEYATFSGSSVNVTNETVHFVATTSALPFTLNQWQPAFNSTLVGLVREFDVKMTIGNAGAFFSNFGMHSVTAGNAVQPDGSPWVGFASANDYRFVPMLRFDGTSNANGFYWQGAGPGFNTDATGTAVGFFDGNVNPLTVSVVASLPAGTPPVPEPSTLMLIGLGVLGLVRTRSRRLVRGPRK